MAEMFLFAYLDYYLFTTFMCLVELSSISYLCKITVFITVLYSSYRLLVMDEIDHLDSKNQEVLYTMFEWPTLHKSRLILIGKVIRIVARVCGSDGKQQPLLGSNLLHEKSSSESDYNICTWPFIKQVKIIHCIFYVW